MQVLINWLGSKNRNYWEGVELFAQLGKNQNLLRFFRASENPTTKEGLYEELKKIAKGLGLEIPLTSLVRVIRIQPNLQVKTYQREKSDLETFEMGDGFEETPISLREAPALEELTKRHAYLFRQKEILRQSLYSYPHNNQREVVAQRKIVMDQILQYKAEIAEIAQKRKFYEKYGYFPQEYQDTKEDIIRKRDNARSNISRQKSLMKSAKTVAEREKAKGKLEYYEKLLMEMEAKLR